MVEQPSSPPSPRRKAPRVEADRIELRLADRQARLVDLSEQGMRFITDEPVEPGSILVATLCAGGQELQVEGTVRWCEAAEGERHSVGVAFRGSNPQVLRQGVLNLLLAAT